TVRMVVPRGVKVMSAKTERMNLRCTSDTLATLKAAAEVQGQDLTSFVMGSALERARAVLAEDRILRLSPAEVVQLERALDAEPVVIPQLSRLFGGIAAAPGGGLSRSRSGDR
ncbi:MAG: DUF1778 domain-containing protein, partial [Propionibacteriaceae bacterium]|nr:DUF1778 domain-containing protein [Propionibacteriaceae bacterium]